MVIEAAKTAKAAEENLNLVLRAIRWIRTNRYPKAPRKTYGLALAIVTENAQQRQQIVNDFIETLKDLLKGGDLNPPFPKN